MLVALTKLVLRQEPSDTALPVCDVTIDDLLQEEDTTAPLWWKVTVLNATACTGYVKKDMVVDLPVAEDVDLARFGDACLAAARGYGTNAFYLIAVAAAESGIKNIRSKAGSSAFGPFQILSGTWLDHIKADPQLGMNAGDRFDPYKECYVAARIAALATVQLAEDLGTVPEIRQVYLCHILGQAGGSAVLRRPLTDSVRNGLLDAYSGSADPNGAVDRVLAGNPGVLTEGGVARTTEGVLDELSKRLDPGLKTATQIIAQREPNLFQGEPGRGDDTAAPWMRVAKGEIGVTEVKGAGSNPRIEEYFKASDSPSSDDDVAWCGAFVAWCLANCGNPAIAAGAAKFTHAASWLNYGNSVSAPAYGVIGVTVPLVDGSSGHVGFVSAWDTRTIEIVAGNQKDQVCPRRFNRELFAGFRQPA